VTSCEGKREERERLAAQAPSAVRGIQGRKEEELFKQVKLIRAWAGCGMMAFARGITTGPDSGGPRPGVL